MSPIKRNPRSAPDLPPTSKGEQEDHRPRRFRVCHLVVLPQLDGSQRVMLDICRALDPSRFELHVICQGEGELTSVLRREGIQVHSVPSLVRPIRPHLDLLALLQIARVCRRYRFDLVHTHNSKGGFLGRLGASLAGVPHIVHHVHGFPFHEFSGRFRHWCFNRLERFAARLSERIIFVNHAERELCVEQGWLSPERGLTVYNGVDLVRFAPEHNQEIRRSFRESCRLLATEVAILAPARLEQAKQCLILPDIARELLESGTTVPWKLLIAGRGALEGPLRQKIAELGLDRQIQLIGWHQHPHKLVSGSDIVLLPSLWEGLPLVLIEAQAAGLPVVASDILGNREVVTPGTGFLCQPQDARSYAQALARLIDDPAQRKQLGRAGLARAQTVFSLEENQARIQAIYQEILSSSATKSRLTWNAPRSTS